MGSLTNGRSESVYSEGSASGHKLKSPDAWVSREGFGRSSAVEASTEHGFCQLLCLWPTAKQNQSTWSDTCLLLLLKQKPEPSGACLSNAGPRRAARCFCFDFVCSRDEQHCGRAPTRGHSGVWVFPGTTGLPSRKCVWTRAVRPLNRPYFKAHSVKAVLFGRRHESHILP